jgi:hypothetical protein
VNDDDDDDCNDADDDDCTDGCDTDDDDVVDVRIFLFDTERSFDKSPIRTLALSVSLSIDKDDIMLYVQHFKALYTDEHDDNIEYDSDNEDNGERYYRLLNNVHTNRVLCPKSLPITEGVV